MTRKKEPFRLFTLVIAAILPFITCLTCAFLESWDDGINICENPVLLQGDFTAIWAGNGLPSYLPLTYSLFFLEHRLFGLEPGGFHLTNLLFHAANACLVYLCLCRFTGRGIALAAALIWAVHPQKTEAVCWITEQKTLLSSFFFLLSLIFYLKNLEGKKIFLAACLLAGILAGFAKLTVFTLPLLLLALEPLLAKRVSKKTVISCGLLLAFYSFLAWKASATEAANLVSVRGMGIPALLHILIAARSSLFYMAKTTLPAGFSPVYPLWPLEPDAWYALSGLVFLAVSAVMLALFLKKDRPDKTIPLCWFFYLLLLLPVSGILPIPYMVNSFVADRYAYLPSIPLILLLVLFFNGVIPWFRERRRMALTAAILILALLSFRQAAAWRNAYTLWDFTLKANPDCEAAHTNLGTWFLDRGLPELALFHYQKAYRVNRDSWLNCYDLGTAFSRLGYPAAAEGYYRAALERRPDYPEALCNLGNALYLQGRVPEALDCLNRALELPHSNEVEGTVRNNFELIRQASGEAR